MHSQGGTTSDDDHWRNIGEGLTHRHIYDLVSGQDAVPERDHCGGSDVSSQFIPRNEYV